MTRPLVFNGINGQTAEYLTPPMDLSRIARFAQGIRLSEQEYEDLASRVGSSYSIPYPTRDGVDPDDLAQSGWAMIFPAADPGSRRARELDAIHEALAPLRAHRRAMATRHHEHLYREVRGEDGYRAGESKQRFLVRMGAGASGPVDPDRLPYYLLLVGGPDEIPYHVQYQLDVQYGVGRIHFDTPDEYAWYAESVVAAETGTGASGRQGPLEAVFFAVANPDDRATFASSSLLTGPLADDIAARMAAEDLAASELAAANGSATHRRWNVSRFLAQDATKAQLASLLGDRAPAFLFTASHGLGFSPDSEWQRQRQGALVCQDWPGPGAKIEPDHYFAGEDITEDADLGGLIAFHFACYGAGTPARDEFWRLARKSPGERGPTELASKPFVATLPKRMLGRRRGALACIGHVDRAWAGSFIDSAPDREHGIAVNLAPFQTTITRLLDGARLGHAMDPLDLRYAELASDLASQIEDIETYAAEPDERALAMNWLLANDARNYAVIGDPAVRIQQSGPDAAPAGTLATQQPR